MTDSADPTDPSEWQTSRDSDHEPSVTLAHTEIGEHRVLGLHEGDGNVVIGDAGDHTDAAAYLGVHGQRGDAEVHVGLNLSADACADIARAFAAAAERGGVKVPEVTD